MPIVVVPPQESLLAQGDILQGVSFGVTAVNGDFVGEPKSRFVMVISRNCNANRDGMLTVAPIVTQKLGDGGGRREEAKPIALTLEGQRRKFLQLSEGGAIQETFYLGPLKPGSDERYAARLNTLATIEVPEEPTTRAKWVSEKRVWRLEADFAHDLHFRLFASYARLGFDDHSWFPDQDLSMMISAGESELHGLEKEVADAELAVLQQQGDGRPAAKDQLDLVAKKKTAVVKLKAELAPYLAERATRGKAG